MNRFTFYLIHINMIANIAASVPKILLNESEKGSITAIIIGQLVGLLFLYGVAKSFEKIKGENFVNLMHRHIPKWFSYPMTILFSLTWFMAGLLSLMTFSLLINRFLTPETSIKTIILMFVLFISYGMMMKGENLLHGAEIIFLIFIPLFFYLFFKTYFNSEMNWNYVKIALTYSNHLPSYSAFTATFYLFVGILNLIIFNQYMKKQLRFQFKHLAIIFITSTIIIFTTYFIPIGISGFDQIDQLVYPWISTSDSFRMRFGVIERVVFIFLLFFLGLAFLNLVIHWHIAASLFNSIIQFKALKRQEVDYNFYIWVILFWIFAYRINSRISEQQLMDVSITFYNLLPIVVVFFFITMMIVIKRMKSAT